MTRIALALSLWLLLPALLACDDDEPKSGSASATRIEVQIHPDDFVECGFGGTKVAGPWDEVSLHADGTIKWTHVDAAASGDGPAGFEKTGKLEPQRAHQWLQDVANLGVFDRDRKEVPGDGERTSCRGTIGGKALDFQVAGLPDPPLRSKLDALTARAIQGS